MRRVTAFLLLIVGSGFLTSCDESSSAVEITLESELDRRVSTFLEDKRGTWRDMNVPEGDGRLLYDLIIDNGYTRALEIGTSTGRSAIWMAWALSRTGGRLITLEINPERYQEAVENIEAAGLSDIVEIRLTDAHTAVKELAGPFDFVFCDADKDWYVNYLDAALPKLTVGGCFTAHNVTSWGHTPRGFLDRLAEIEELETTIDDTSGAGLSMSVKRAPSATTTPAAP